jgi:hypothetical protein
MIDDVEQELGADHFRLCTDLVLEEEVCIGQSGRVLVIVPSDGDCWTFATFASESEDWITVAPIHPQSQSKSSQVDRTFCEFDRCIQKLS